MKEWPFSFCKHSIVWTLSNLVGMWLGILFAIDCCPPCVVSLSASTHMIHRFHAPLYMHQEQKALKLGYEGPPIFKSRLGPAPVLGQAAGLYQIDDVKPNANSGVAHFAVRRAACRDHSSDSQAHAQRKALHIQPDCLSLSAFAVAFLCF